MALITTELDKQMGTARNSRFENKLVRASSLVQAPSTRLPPEEKGEIAVA